MIQVIPVPALRDNYIWLIRPPGNQSSNPAEPASAGAVIVDPGDAAPVLAALAQHRLRPLAVLITHRHPDHVAGVPELRRRYALPVYGPAGIEPAPDHFLYEGDTVTLDGGLDLHVLEIPGHTREHIAYHGHGLLFCGDTLFAGGCGRLLGGTAPQLYASLQRLAALPDETRIYCGHEYTLVNLRFAARIEPENARLAARLDETMRLRERGMAAVPSTLAEEKATNPFLRCHVAAVKRAAERFCDRPLNTDLEVFAMIRAWKDTL
jgi:hydroxyacylglutathione hydrolase